MLTFADFAGEKEADIEDMFDPAFYLQLVNGEFKKGLVSALTEADLTVKAPRILVKLEKYLEQHPLKGGESFNHFRPARYFTANISTLEASLSSTTLDRFEAAFKAVNALL